MNPSDSTTKLIDGEYFMERFPGKGGWTYILIPELAPDPHRPFGWRHVRVILDHLDLGRVKLMPKGNQQLFLPVNLKTRKALGKTAGDQVRVQLYEEQDHEQILQLLNSCFAQEPPALKQAFEQLPAFERNIWLDRIADQGDEEAQARAITELMRHLERRTGQ